MSALKLQLVRAERGRFPLKENVELKLTSIEEGHVYKVRGIDTSARGFGFMSNKPFALGKIFWLELNNRKFSIEIVHCESHLGIDNMFRCGAFARDTNADLQKIFHAISALASDTPTS